MREERGNDDGCAGLAMCSWIGTRDGPVRAERELEELGLGLPWAYKEVKEG